MAVAASQMFRQGNNTENLFLDYVGNKIEGMALGAPGVDEFHRTFNEIYGVYVTWPELQQILRDTGPQQKKLLLRSVFGGMVARQPGTPLSSLPPLREAQVLEIAHKFAIRPAFEQHVAATQAAQLGFNPLGNFNLDLLQDSNIDAKKFEALKKNVSEAILSTPQGQAFNLNAALNKTELDHHSKQDEASMMFGGFQKVIDNFSTIINPLNVGGDNNFFAFFGQILSKIMGFFMPMLSSFTEMAKNFNQANKEPSAPLDEEDINKTPELSEKALEFAELSNILAGMGGEQGRRLTAELNKEWRVNPSTPEVWEKIIKGLVKHAPEEADKWLRAKEQKYVADLAEVVEDREKKERAVGGITPATAALRKNLTNYRMLLTHLEDPVLSYATDEYKKKNFKLRYEMFQQYSTDMDTIINKYNEETKAIQNEARAIDQQREATRQQGLAGVAAPVSLGQRLAALGKEIGDLHAKAVNSHNDMATAETHLDVTVVPALTIQFNTHQAELSSALTTAQAEKKKADRIARRGH